MSHHTLWRPPLHPIHPPLHLIYCPPNDTNTLSSWYPSIPYPLAISRQRSIEFVSTFGEGIWCTPHLQHLWCARLQPWWPYSTLPRLHDDRRSSLYAWQRPVPVGAPSNSAQTRLVHDIWCRGRSGFIGRGWPLLWFCQQCLYCQLIPTHTIQTAITTIEWRGRTLFSDHYRRGIGMTTINWGYQTSGIRAWYGSVGHIATLIDGYYEPNIRPIHPIQQSIGFGHHRHGQFNTDMGKGHQLCLSDDHELVRIWRMIFDYFNVHY